ncbi:MAG: TonB-dependent receptor [Bacteroidales bacterium]|nr:TonB-dependent receptor [Bacteroidales bacterium]
MKKIFVLAALLGCSFLCTNAQVLLDEIVVTGTGTHRRLSNSPAPIQVITAADIKNAHVTNFEDALTKLAPNITTMTNGMGTFISMNGMKDEYTVILENGRRLSGDDRYNRINVANIKRIEILSGAASALYGSDAIGGVINIITDDLRNSVNVGTQTQYTSKGRFSQSINADVNLGNFSICTSYQRRESDNWQVNNIDENGYKTGRPMSTGFRSDNISERITYKINDKLQLYVRGNLYDYQTNRPQQATYFKASSKKDENGNVIYNETQAYKYNMKHGAFNVGAGMKYTISKNAYIDAEIYSDNYTSKYKYFVKSGDFEPNDEQDVNRTHYYNANVKGIFKLGNWNKLSVGMEAVNEEYRSESDNISFKSMYTLAVFAQDELDLGANWQGVVGMRYIYNENFKNYATPNVALMYKLGGFHARASIATAFRSPTLYQIHGTDESKTSDRATIGNLSLKPEKSIFYTINAEYTHSRFAVSVTGFHNHISDMIDYGVLTEEEIIANGAQELHQKFGTIRQRKNINKATIKGLSINAQAYLGFGFTLGGGFIHTNSEAKTQNTKGEWVITPVDKSVKNSGNFFARWNQSWDNYILNVQLNGHIQSRRYSTTYGYSPRYSQWDLTTRHTFQLNGYSIEPGLGVENIFNKRDTRPWNSNFSTINPGRAVVLSLVLKYNK